MANPNLQEIPLPPMEHKAKSKSPLKDELIKSHKKTAKEMLQEALKDHKLSSASSKEHLGKSITALGGNFANTSQQPTVSSQSIVDELFKDFISQKFGGASKDNDTSGRVSKTSSVDDKISQILDMEISSIKSKTLTLDETGANEKLRMLSDSVKSTITSKKDKIGQEGEQSLLKESSTKQSGSTYTVKSASVGKDDLPTTSLACHSEPETSDSVDSKPEANQTDKKGTDASLPLYSNMLPLAVAKKLGAPKLLKMKLSSESLSLIKSTDHVDKGDQLWEEGEVCSSHSDKSDQDISDDDSKDAPSETGSIASSGAHSESHGSKHKKKRKHKHKKKKKKSKDKGKEHSSSFREHSSRSRDPEAEDSTMYRERKHSREISSEREDLKRRKSGEKYRKRKKSHSRSRTPKKHRKSRSHSRSRSPSKRKDSTDSERYLYSEWDARNYSETSNLHARLNEPSSERHKRSRDRSKSAEREQRLQIDKAKLRRIAIANALQNMKSGQGPRVDLTLVKSGGKSVEELTEFCKKISSKSKDKEESDSDDLSDLNEAKLSDDEDRLIHHPFKVREPASNNIIMNIRNAKQLPVLTPSEKQAQQASLRLTFPVSSGSHHRASESEWVPVEKPPPPVAVRNPVQPQVASVEPPAVNPKKSESIFPDVSEGQKLDISTIITERLQAVRKLQENPYDVQALNKMHKVQEQASKWAISKHLPGQFMGSTGAHVLSQEELIGDKKRQAWARKTQLMHAAPVTGGIGMFLLQKMGWKQGEGLGKNNEGNKEPLLLDIKIDRKGLTAAAENPKQQKVQMSHAARAKDLSNKHPVSALMELCNRRRWGPPIFTVVEESGPDHKKTFLFKVKINNVEYQPASASLNKKTAKAQCATVCLQEMGLLPRDPPT
ncbi:protein SON-like [Biomphalaria glabrata]|uniref:Protein SON-like n=1 Tax=Biomphalaria glabrata TaxID=6526 RepID=A0A9W3ANW4_BIOGL|nr:protein SON-like [Biomphalaria glabrata]XP_055888931.1 protein SON-like [Biomphalaria glabrata]XP_055888932.1 protein SON-like [Biomphalaria glabrata]